MLVFRGPFQESCYFRAGEAIQRPLGGNLLLLILFKDPPRGFCYDFSRCDYSGTLRGKPVCAVASKLRLMSLFFVVIVFTIVNFSVQ